MSKLGSGVHQFEGFLLREQAGVHACVFPLPIRDYVNLTKRFLLANNQVGTSRWGGVQMR